MQNFLLCWKRFLQCTDALSFDGSKMILAHPNYFGQAPIVSTGQIHFGWVQIILETSKLLKLVQKNLISFWQKWFGLNQNNLDQTKTVSIRTKQFERSKSFWTFRRTGYKLTEIIKNKIEGTPILKLAMVKRL